MNIHCLRLTRFTRATFFFRRKIRDLKRLDIYNAINRDNTPITKARSKLKLLNAFHLSISYYRSIEPFFSNQSLGNFYCDDFIVNV